MHIADFITQYRNNLDQTIREVEAFNGAETLWQTVPGVLNPAGNLALHLAGNLETFIGAVLGNTGYVRDREAEFTLRDIPAAEVVRRLQLAKSAVESTLTGLSDDSLTEPYPSDKFGEGKTTGFALIYLLAHLNYHLGQINYLRRILAK